jgi:cytochrome c peroxidase
MRRSIAKTFALIFQLSILGLSTLSIIVYAQTVYAQIVHAQTVYAQKDPGPRSGAPGAGFPYPTLNPSEVSIYSHAFLHFVKPVSVSGTLEKGKGLGPTFNGNSCAMCHAQPSIGGSSPGITSPEEPHPNPQVALAHLDGATNSVPSFITASGPVLVARFLRKPDGSRDGDVHALYTIAGRSDAKGCTLKQPDFARQVADNNIALRIPTPLFGLGLVENTSDAVLRANLQSTAAARAKLGIGGVFNTNPDDGAIMRFGWKAHRKSLLMFSAEAASLEEGISSELFPIERDLVAGCEFNATPEDSGSLLNPDSGHLKMASPIPTASDLTSEIDNFATFIRLSAPAKPGPSTRSTVNGSKLFAQVGCALCHSPSLTTGASPYTGMSNVTYHPYSDFALHHMGPRLADGIYQGEAGSDQFRTAPLWGVGQRLFFLHDGRTADLLQAVLAHQSGHNAACETGHSHSDDKGCSSEADSVIQKFKLLVPSQIQDLLNFLRSL